MARLLRDGPQPEAALAPALHQDIKDTRRLLTPLYRAALVERLEGGLWTNSRLGERLLQRFEILDIASLDLVNALRIDDQDKKFLKHWFEASLQKESQSCVAQLRTLTAAENNKSLHWADDSATKRSILVFACHIAIDPWAQRLATERGHQAIHDWFSSALFCYGGETKCNALSSRKAQPAPHVFERFSAALRKYHDSNEILILIPKTKKIVSDDVTTRLTWMRALNVAIWGTADQGLAACSRNWHRDDFEGFWRLILSERKEADAVRSLYRQWTGHTEKSFESLATALATRLRVAVMETSQPTGVSNPPGLPDPGADLDLLILLMRRATLAFSHSDTSLVPECPENFLTALKELNAAVAAASAAKNEDKEKTDLSK